MKNPVHPGANLREDVLAALGISVSVSAESLGVSRVTLIRVINEGSADFLVRVSGVLPGLCGSFLGEFVMPSDQISFTDVEYSNRRRVSRREQFLDTMDATIPWSRWVGLIEPFYYSGHRGRKPKALETMLRMYLLQAWFSLSDEGVEDAIYDSYAMRRFLGLDFTVEQVPDATTLLHFRHLLEKHQLGRKLLESQGEIFDEQGWIMRGGTIVDATIIAAPSSTKNADGARDPEMLWR